MLHYIPSKLQKGSTSVVKYHYLFGWNVNYHKNKSAFAHLYKTATLSAVNTVVCIACGLNMTETPKIRRNSVMVCECVLRMWKELVLALIIACTIYRIVGKFGRENVWRINSFQVFGRKQFGK